MSVIYGADALAGVINIITKKINNKKISVNANVQEETAGKEYGWDEGIHNQYLGASYNYKNWFISGGIGRNLFQGWKDTATGRELTWHKKDQIIGNVVLSYRAGKLNAYYRFDGLDEIITNPANPAGGQPALDQDYISDRVMQQLQATYNFSSRLIANALASYTHFTRQVYSTLYYANGDVRVSTAPGTQSLSTFNGATFRASAVYSPSQFVSFQPGVDVNIETGEGDRIKSGTQKIEDYAFFITAEITLFKWLNIRPGVRFINNSVYDAPPVVPSLNTRITLTKDLDLRFAYARGFRSPSLRELYYVFFDATHSIQGNPDLKAEHSNSFTGSLSLQKKLASYLLTGTLSGFYNDVDNLIGTAVNANNPAVTTYLNITRYKTVGSTVSADLHHNRITAALGYSYTGRYNAYNADNKSLPEFKFSSEINATAGYTFPKIGLNANLFYKYTGKLPYYQEVINNNITEIRLAQTDGYHIADLTFNKTLFKLLVLNAGVRNLFDVTRINNSAVSSGAHAVTGATAIGYGRSYFLGLAFNWSK
jgi:outer membrane receptor for ferrienterochelin and colicins